MTVLALFNEARAQQNMGIGTATPDASAILELSANDKGVLVPRLTESQKNAISLPATGLLVYQTNNQFGFWYFDGTQWVPINGGSGITGPTGPIGPTGVNGITGPTGPVGSAGTNGSPGPTGPTGLNGLNGIAGPTGPTGATGSAGPDAQTLTFNSGTSELTISGGNTVTLTGGSGATGPTGPTGINGANGNTGPTGPTGQNGNDGATGPTGATGATGANGINGNDGATGPTGPAGLNGNNGVTGPTGPDAQTLTYNSGTGELAISGGNSVTISGGGGATGPTGASGTNGATGPTGDAGHAGPEGPQGPTGPAGAAGSNGTTGPTGPTGANGTNGANGATGPTGPTGSNGTNGSTGPTGPAGTNGSTGPTGPTGTGASLSCGTNNQVLKNSSGSIACSIITDNGTNVGVSSAAPGVKFDIFGASLAGNGTYRARYGWYVGQDPVVGPSVDTWGLCGTFAESWWEVNAYGVYQWSQRSRKRSIIPLDNSLLSEAWKDIQKIRPSLYKFNADNDNFNKDDPNHYREQMRLGVILDETPDYIQDKTFSHIDVYALSTLTLSGVKYLGYKVENIEKSVKSEDFGTINANGDGYFTVSFNDDFSDIEAIPVVNLTLSSFDAKAIVKEKTKKSMVIEVRSNEPVSIDWTAHKKITLDNVVNNYTSNVDRVGLKLDVPADKKAEIIDLFSKVKITQREE